MDINRHNYEEYFLLYADNELSKAQRKMVEIFVNENPEFKEEFCMLKLTINLPDEEARLEDKSFLYKNQTPLLINENNYEEIFVLYHDNELSETERLETENYVTQHPELTTEFGLIGKAKLQPESSVVYPGKKELHRKEKSGKVVSMMIWRYLAAAVLVGFGLWFSIPYFTKQSVKTPVTAQQNPVMPSGPATPDVVTVRPKDAGKQPRQVASANQPETSNHLHNVKQHSDHKSQRLQPARTVALTKSEPNNPTLPMTEPIQELKKEPVEVAALKTQEESVQPNLNNLEKPIENQAQSEVQKPVEIKPKYSQTVAYDASVNNDNYVFYDVPADQFRKTKVGGFLKKVKRIVERTNPLTRLLEGNEEPVVANKF